MPIVKIESSGLFTTVQDNGRYGYQRFGMPVSGAMDIFSLELANLLVSNSPDNACLEATYSGPEILFTSTGAVAICGADMGPLKNGIPVPMNKTIPVKNWDRLSFTGLRNGCRSYISFAGGIDVPAVMGSRSTYLRARIGGFQGRALKAGDQLELGQIERDIMIKEIPAEILPEYLPVAELRVIPGPEIDQFDDKEIRNFLISEYNVTEQSDRMGYRLSGEKVNHKAGGADIISAGISPGTIQVPGNGQPIILMADRQTTGGYTRIANIITADLHLVAQLKPGDKVRFREVTIDEAQKTLSERSDLIREYLK